MKKFKGIISIVLVITIIMGTPILSFAGNKLSETEIIEYEETHDQIVFDDLSVLVINGDEIVVEIDPTISVFKRYTAEKQKEKYDNYVKENTSITAVLFEKIQAGENVCVLSYTETPVVAVEDHYERIPKTDASKLSAFGVTANAASKIEVSEASKAAKERFGLGTIVIREGDSNPYLYTAITIGAWENHISVFSGENVPAEGWDYVIQSCPVITSTNEFSCEYNYKTDGSTIGKEGTHFVEVSGEDSRVVYSVLDDPLGLAQLSDFVLTQTFKAKATTKTKKIHSYYIHTWDSMSISVSGMASAGMSGGDPVAEVGVGYSLSKEKKWWPVHNSVVYNF